MTCIGFHRRVRQTTSFTLIEILVAIVIVAILVALMVPVFQSAKYQARRVACIHSIKQLSLALATYANDFDGRVPLDQDLITVQGPEGILTYGAQKARWPVHLQWQGYLQGFKGKYWLFPSTDSMLICPSDDRSLWPSSVSYELMQEIGGSYLYNAETRNVQGHAPDMDQAKKILLIDGETKIGGSLSPYAFNQFGFTSLFAFPGYPTQSRHLGKSNALFFDWHVESIDPSKVTTNQVKLN